MTDWERNVYADMKSVDRVLLLMVKVMDLLEFQKVLTREDWKLVDDLIKRTKADTK